MDCRLLVEESIANIGKLVETLVFFLKIFNFLDFLCLFGSLQTSLLCILGELAWGGSVTVAVWVSDRGQIIRNNRRVTHDT